MTDDERAHVVHQAFDKLCTDDDLRGLVVVVMDSKGAALHVRSRGKNEAEDNLRIEAFAYAALRLSLKKQGLKFEDGK